MLYAKTGIGADILCSFPFCSADFAAISLGSKVAVSPIGIIGGLSNSISFYSANSFLPAVIGSVLWGAAFFALGIYRVIRREM